MPPGRRAADRGVRQTVGRVARVGLESRSCRRGRSSPPGIDQCRAAAVRPRTAVRRLPAQPRAASPLLRFGSAALLATPLRTLDNVHSSYGAPAVFGLLGGVPGGNDVAVRLARVAHDRTVAARPSGGPSCMLERGVANEFESAFEPEDAERYCVGASLRFRECIGGHGLRLRDLRRSHSESSFRRGRHAGAPSDVHARDGGGHDRSPIARAVMLVLLLPGGSDSVRPTIPIPATCQRRA